MRHRLAPVFFERKRRISVSWKAGIIVSGTVQEGNCVKNILVTGGTVFVSRQIAEYFLAKGQNVFVLNRNSREQPAGAQLIEADRHHLGEILRSYHFDAVIDTAYTGEDVSLLMDALGDFGSYVLISSSAVYSESGTQPFKEEEPVGVNRYWGRYGTDKIEAERTARQRKPGAYILRPPYLYGPMNDIYREAFVFECALKNRAFYLPGDGKMRLQFLYVGDLCRFIDRILEQKPDRHTFNVGNPDTVSVREWVELCYEIAGRQARFVNVPKKIAQRDYFCFSEYEYVLDVSWQNRWMADLRPMRDGLRESLYWYERHADQVERRPYIEYIETKNKCQWD